MIGTIVLTRPSLCSKSAVFREAWHIVNLQPCPCPLEADLSNDVYNFVLAQGAQKLQLQVQTKVCFTKENGDIKL